MDLYLFIKYLFSYKGAGLLLILCLMRDQRIPRPYGWGFKAVRKTSLPHRGIYGSWFKVHD